MFLPIGDENNPKTTPWVTYGLIATNLYLWLAICWPAQSMAVDPLSPDTLAYLAAMRQATGVPTQQLLHHLSAYDLILFNYGFRPGSPSVVALVTSLFLHGGWAHVSMNMLYLWVFGDNIEARLGGKAYLLLYAAAGVAATLFYAAFAYGSPMPLIGASGAISGILGAYCIWYGHHRVRVLMVLIIFIQVVRLPARFVLGFFFVVQNLLPFVLPASASNTTAYGAHIGGFVTGALFALAYAHKEATGVWGAWPQWLAGLKQALRSRAPAAAGPSVGEDAAADALPKTARGVREALHLGEVERACLGYCALEADERRSLGTAATFTLADSLTQARDYDRAAQVLKRFLGDAAQHTREDVARGHLRLGLLQAQGLRLPTAAREHLFAVLDLLPHSPEAQAAADALGQID